jgi:hypothetical protein
MSEQTQTPDTSTVDVTENLETKLPVSESATIPYEELELCYNRERTLNTILNRRLRDTTYRAEIQHVFLLGIVYGLIVAIYIVSRRID